MNSLMMVESTLRRTRVTLMCVLVAIAGWVLPGQAQDVRIPGVFAVRAADGQNDYLDIPGIGGVVHAGPATVGSAVDIESTGAQGGPRTLMRGGTQIRIYGHADRSGFDAEKTGKVYAWPASAGRSVGYYTVEKVANQSPGAEIQHGEQFFLRSSDGNQYLLLKDGELTRSSTSEDKTPFVLVTLSEFIAAGGDPNHRNIAYVDIDNPLGVSLSCKSNFNDTCGEGRTWTFKDFSAYALCQIDVHETTATHGGWDVKSTGPQQVQIEVGASGSGDLTDRWGGSIGVSVSHLRFVRNDATDAQLADAHCVSESKLHKFNGNMPTRLPPPKFLDINY